METSGAVPFAERVARLGTETAFAVGAECAAWEAKGNAVYPFHLGDIDLATPRNVVEAADRAIAAGKTGYCPNGGIPELRQALADEISATHGVAYGPENVAVQPGGKPVISKFLLALMDPGDEVLYPNPGFPIYESQIQFLGGVAKPYGFVPGAKNFLLDFEAIEAAITPRTKLLIFNDLHNPTGAESPDREREALAALVRKHDLYVLSDEAYWDIRYSGASKSIASLPGMQERTVILYTFSKKYAMTGWRLGAAVGPAPVIDVITRLNVNIESCPTHFSQYGALAALTGDQRGPREMMATLKTRRDAALEILNATPGVRCLTPETTFYLYPDVTGAAQAVGCADHEGFRRLVLERTGVSFCTRLHFGHALEGERRIYLRLAYSGLGTDQIKEGLGKMKAFIESHH